MLFENLDYLSRLFLLCLVARVHYVTDGNSSEIQRQPFWHIPFLSFSLSLSTLNNGFNFHVLRFSISTCHPPPSVLLQIPVNVFIILASPSWHSLSLSLLHLSLSFFSDSSTSLSILSLNCLCLSIHSTNSRRKWRSRCWRKCTTKIAPDVEWICGRKARRICLLESSSTFGLLLSSPVKPELGIDLTIFLNNLEKLIR